jgi:hypothetical protein
MTPARAAAYIGGAVLLAAWLSSAATYLQDPDPTPPATPEPTSGTESIAADVQAQAARLRAKLAVTPAPQQPTRNPFAFAVRDARRVRQQVHAAALEEPPAASTAPVVPVEPRLSLVGMAEREAPGGPVRIAVIAGEGDEVFLVEQGQELAGRYRVVAIAADAVELQDLSDGAVRRLVLP